MKLIIALSLVLMFCFFCVAELGDDWDKFNETNNNVGSSVGVNIKTDVLDTASAKNYDGDSVYTFDFYVALVVGVLGFLVVVVFLYFFFRKPKNQWEKKGTK